MSEPICGLFCFSISLKYDWKLVFLIDWRLTIDQSIPRNKKKNNFYHRIYSRHRNFLAPAMDRLEIIQCASELHSHRRWLLPEIIKIHSLASYARKWRPIVFVNLLVMSLAPFRRPKSSYSLPQPKLDRKYAHWNSSQRLSSIKHNWFIFYGSHPRHFICQFDANGTDRIQRTPISILRIHFILTFYTESPLQLHCRIQTNVQPSVLRNKFFP